jgi:hypothetical protein
MRIRIVALAISISCFGQLHASEVNKLTYMHSQRQMTPVIGSALTLTDMYFNLTCQKQISLVKLKELQATPQFEELKKEVKSRGTLGLSAVSNVFGKNIECD